MKVEAPFLVLQWYNCHFAYLVFSVKGTEGKSIELISVFVL